MGNRAKPSGRILTEENVKIIKGMLQRGDRQHDIAAWFGVNGGRVAEVASGARYEWVKAASVIDLPIPGPYPVDRITAAALMVLNQAAAVLASLEQALR